MSSQPPYRPPTQPHGVPPQQPYPGPNGHHPGPGYGPPQQQPGYGQQGYPQQGYPPPHQPAGPPLAAPPAKKRKRWPFVVGGIVALLLIIGIVNRPDTPAPSPTATAPAAVEQAPAPAAPAAGAPAAAQPAAPVAPAVDPSNVTYEVTGDGVAEAGNITYVKDENLGQQQANDVDLPWSTTVQIPDGIFRPLSIVAQSGSGRDGTITCRILDANGAEITSSTSSGPYAVVTCAG